jgi:16S rRNA A1518/A1519 N6-dimethyltransferase RsmA/KsgA/DIM1 with predicted DNA glycosylase/AP lyase activity
MVARLMKKIEASLKNPRGMFGQIITWIMNYAHKAQFETLIKSINITDDDTVLEIGFGDGLMLAKLINLPKSVKFF